MIVKQIWTANAYRNFNYLIACGETGEAIAIDPLDHEKCLKAADDLGWKITQILNTHEHHDHTGGNEALVRRPAPRSWRTRTPETRSPTCPGPGRGGCRQGGQDRGARGAGHPGHTMCHVCLLSHTDQPALFSGDTLFNAGAGNCHNGGHPAELYRTFSEQLARLPPSTLVYPGHDYVENNLRFTLNREPETRMPGKCSGELAGQDPSSAYVSTLEVETRINTFFRLTSPTVIAKLREAFPDLPETPDPRTVFLKLRELRNTW